MAVKGHLVAAAEHAAALRRSVGGLKEELGLTIDVQRLRDDVARLADDIDLIVSDLPWGDAVGSHGGNSELYPHFLQEYGSAAWNVAVGPTITLHDARVAEQSTPSRAP